MTFLNKIYQRVCASLIVLSLFGCANLTPTAINATREFTYDFSVKGKLQPELWRNARDFFAETYGDSRAVFRVMDEKDGTIIGRGTASWILVNSALCYTDYYVRFAAKDEKARLQFEIIEGVPALSTCVGWPLPSVSGYDSMVLSFQNASKGLESALKGNSSTGKLKDF